MIFEIALLLFLALLIYVLLGYVKHLSKLKDFPPGPYPLPVIGNLHLVGSKAYESFRDLSTKYGDVFSISLGMQRVVIVNSKESVREALITKGTHFAGRPNNMYHINLLSRNAKAISFADYGPLWVFQRKLGHAALKMYGDSNSNLEAKVIVESEELHVRIREYAGEPIDVHFEFGLAVINVICSIVFGNRYNCQDKEFADVITVNNLIMDGFSNGDPVSFLPWLRFFPFDGVRKLKEAIRIRDPFLRRKLTEHRETYNPEHIRDFTDCLIKTSMEEEAWKNVGLKKVTDDHLEMIIFDIFIAGGETTTTILQWMTIYLLHWPEIQEEVYNEIIQAIGSGRYPELKDRQNLPLTQAVIQETLRLSSIVPLGLPHKATVDSSISGKNVPKDTQILFNFWNLHHNPAEWEDPEHFKPHRWLDEEGKYVPGRHKSFLPFSAGRRVCLGESLAKTELFLLFSRFIRDFKIEANPDEPFPSLQGRIGIILSPHPYTAIIKPRVL